MSNVKKTARKIRKLAASIIEESNDSDITRDAKEIRSLASTLMEETPKRRESDKEGDSDD